ncbi:MAG: 2-oxo acid dehydrogenase subunit E2 [Candidatus Aenigmarchaeota archaeon]|nr:2-oxo acid dehydrogenase subunit E2 [Candidatus Aenigmarchaeota archaeon]
MPKEFKFPDIGEGIEEGEIVKWHVKEGDKVEEHQVVGEVETDKAVAEIPSPYSGIVLKINFKEGETVKVGQVLFVIGEEGETVSETKPEVKAPVFKAAGAVGYLEEAPEEEDVQPRHVVAKPVTVESAVLATPIVRNLARQLGVDITKVVGTGPEGRITEDDVKKSIETTEEKSPEIKKVRKYDMWGYVDHVPLKGIRKSIARHMVESVKHIPHVATMDEADVTELAKLREREKIKAQEKGIKLTYLPFIMKACVAALKEFPLLNATLDEENEDIIVRKYYSIGFAVDVDGEGLVVPVIKYAENKSILDIAKELQDLAEKARIKKLDLNDMRGGSFSITNYGSIGGIFATPIINYPESAILGMGRIYEKPLIVEGKIEVRKVLPLSLVFDHRVADGAYAARFLNALILNLKNPEKLLE